MRNKWYLVMIAVVAFFMIGCKGKADEQSGPVVLQVGDAKITANDVNQYIKQLPDMQKSMLAAPEGKKMLMQQFEQAFLLGEKARKDGLADSPDFKFQLRMAEEQILAQTLVKKEILDGVVVSDEDAKKYYDEHAAEFSAESVSAHHILVKDQAKADALYKQIKAAPAKFEELAKKNSIDPGSKDKGGDLGSFEKGRMVPEFEAAAFALKPGEISKPVKTNFGFHIIRLDKKDSGAKSFDSVKEQIKSQLVNTKRKEKYDKMMEDLKKEMKPTLNEDVLKNEVGKGIEMPKMPAGMPGMPPSHP